MKYIFISIIWIVVIPNIFSQDLTEGLQINDLELHPMQDVAKPSYLDTIIDPSFGTVIRRISDAGSDGVIVPMYSTIQAWNSDESYMILYNQTEGNHMLLDGMSYEIISTMIDILPVDLEQIFWDFNDPDVFYFNDAEANGISKYIVSTGLKETLVDFASIITCNGEVEMGNNVQMMSWNSDVFTFRCENEQNFAYKISTNELTTFNESVEYTALAVAPSGNLFYHKKNVYDFEGNFLLSLNKDAIEHSCIGKMTNGNDAYFSIAFAEGPQGGCIGDIIAHDMNTGNCFPLISQSQGYNYPQSGTHISAIAHKNTEGGWMAASMIGYDEDGQSLLDQELVIAKADEGNVKVCRIAHHRSDENEFDYWGEPHAVISPTGTRVLFASDWSGIEDGQSIDSYVVELPSFQNITSTEPKNIFSRKYELYPNPINEDSVIELANSENKDRWIKIYSCDGKIKVTSTFQSNYFGLGKYKFDSGIYFFSIFNDDGVLVNGRFVK